MITKLMMPAKMATLGLLKIKIFWNEGFDVIISVHDVSNKRNSNYMHMWSYDQSLVTLAFLWKKLSWSQFYKNWTGKTTFFEGWSWFNLNNLGLALGMGLKFYTSLVCRGHTIKINKWGPFSPTILNRIKLNNYINYINYNRDVNFI